MKKIITILAILILSGDILLHSEDFILPSTTSIVITEKKENNPRIKPKAPNRQRILCFYDNGHLNITFSIPEGYCQMTVTDLNTGISNQCSFDSYTGINMYVGILAEAHIEISTANGHEYEGWLGIEE